MTTKTTGPVCSSCGRPIRPGDQFCTGCGTSVPGTTKPAPSDRPLYADDSDPTVTRTMAPVTVPESRHPVRMGLLAAGVVAIIAVASVVGFAIGHSDNEPEAAPAPTVTVTATETTTPEPSPTPTTPTAEEQFAQAAAEDAGTVEALVGQWVPQLAAFGDGVVDEAGWNEALVQWQHLEATYPDAVLVATSSWPASYELGGMYAVVIPTAPGTDSGPALSWCGQYAWPQSQECAAKLLDTEGTWEDNYDAGA